MSDPQVIFEQLTQANPVNHVAPLHENRPDVDDVLDSIRSGHGWTATPFHPNEPMHNGWRVAVASLLIALGLGLPLLFLAQRDSGPIEPVDQIEILRQDAVDVTREWLDSVRLGDIETVMSLSGPSATGEADRRLVEWLAGFAANGMPTNVKSCEVREIVDKTALVDCVISLEDLVAVELAVSDLVAPFRYESGLVVWQPYEGGDIGKVNEAYSTYLRMFHKPEYDEVCSPSAYEPGSVIQDQLLALTGECADLAASVAGEVVQWIRQGRPNAEG